MRTSENSSRLLVVIVFLALFVLAPASQAQSGPVVWVARSLQRIGPDDSPGSNLQVQLSAARGEYESFQIVVRAPGSAALSNVNVSVSDLTGPGGAVIPQRNLSLFREQYVYVGTSSPNWSGSNRPLAKGWYPDGLIPFTDPQTGNPLSGAQLKAVPFSLNVSKNQPIWVDVLVPRDATPGAYSGTFSVTSNQGNVSGQISLTVWSFTLPLKPALESSFLTWTTGSLATHQELLRNRLNPQKAAVADERSLMDNFGLASRDAGFWSGADISSCTMSAAPTVTQFKSAAATHQPGLMLYDYSADEIWKCTNLYPTIKQWAANMHQAGIDNLITMAPVPELYDDGTGSGRSAVDIWVMLPLLYDKNPNNVQYAIAKGDRAWSYSCLVQDAYSPKWLIDFDPMNFRVQPGFINQSLNLTGILYWRVDLWSSDPWNNVYSSSFPTYPGEGMLVYPGATVGIQGVAPSMRLKWLRDGADDYDYIELLKQAGQGAWALQVAAGVGANWSQWSHDGNVAEAARLQLGQQLDALGGGGLNPPAPPVNPSPPQAPGTPGNLAPANGASGVSLTPSLTWSAASNATSYDVYFGTSSSPGMVGTTTNGSYNPGTLNASTTYYWRVVAKNSAGSTSSYTCSFTTPASVSPPPVTPGSANRTRFVPITPCRVLDTRNAAGPFGGPFLAGGQSRSFALPQGACGLPSSAQAYSLNLTVVPRGGLGFVTIWPTGQTQPNVSTLNSHDGRIKANAAIVPAGTSGAVSVYASDATDVLLDVNGYFTDDQAQLQFYPVAPCRVTDTRISGGAIAAGATRTVGVQASCGIPSNAQAYALNVTALPQSGSLFYLTAWPTGSAKPHVSTLNATTGTVTANAAILPAGTGGQVNFYATDATHLVVDINGYFAPAGSGGLNFYTLAPCRVADTRNAAGRGRADRIPRWRGPIRGVSR